MKCLVAPDLRQTLTLLPLICDKNDLFLPLICNKSKKLLNSYSIFPFILYLKLSFPSAIFLASSGLLVVTKSTPESTHF